MHANLFQHIITRSYSAHCECFSKEIIGIVGIIVSAKEKGVRFREVSVNRGSTVVFLN
jgi:hypothetical protein